MKWLSRFVAVVFLSTAVTGMRFNVENCILMDVDGVVTISAERDGQIEFTFPLNLEEISFTTSGNCSDGDTSDSMTVNFNVSEESTVVWAVLFATTADNSVEMDQTIRFTPSLLFQNDSLPDGLAILADVGSTELSQTNESFICNAEQSIAYNESIQDNYTFSASQVIRNLQVQAFNLQDNSYGPAVECAADNNDTTTINTPTTQPAEPTTEPSTPTTVEPITEPANETSTEPPVEPTTEPPVEPTTEPSNGTSPETSVEPTAETTTVLTTTLQPVPVPGDVPVVAFAVFDNDNVTCFLLSAGLQIVVEYVNVNGTQELSSPIVITMDNETSATGSCSNGTDSPATMIITTSALTLQITETVQDDSASSALSLTVNVSAIPDAAANQSLTFEMAGRSFQLNDVTTFYVCNVMESLEFSGTRTTLFTNDLQLQAFNLNNGQFSGTGVECGLDPNPTAEPAQNTYVVENGNTTCIVLRGDIQFTNIKYNMTNGNETVEATAEPISIPRINSTNNNVRVSGNCNMQNGTAQDLVITFFDNWSLTLTFAQGSEVTSMLGATQEEYVVQDIKFDYFLTPMFFPNASQQDAPQTAQVTDIPNDFMKGSVGGGSYKCNAQLTQTLDNGVVMETTNLQYKAFNQDNSQDFNAEVSECPGDDDSDNIVPIAVGCALGGLVILLLVAYLIGRHRNQKRKGYNTI